MNYLEEAISSSLISDQLFYEEILEQSNIERDFMLACFENNIILEADAPESEKKGNWLQQIIGAIKNIFNKFIENTQNLFKNDEKWIKDNIPKLKSINYDGLNVNVLPYWKLKTSDITNTLNNLQKEINAFKIGDRKLANLGSREQVEQYGEFKKYVKRNGTFADGIKAYFKVGETNTPNPVSLSGNALKMQCVNEMGKYVAEYNSTLLPTLKSNYNNFTQMLNNVDRQLKQSKPVGESFCVIENAYYGDTELAFCSNYNMLFEADANKIPANNNNNNQTNNDNKPVLNKVEDTSSDNNDTNTDTSTGQNAKNVTSKGNTEYYNYLKNAIQLNQIAVAAALTACEERYRAYMSILRGVVGARSK